MTAATPLPAGHILPPDLEALARGIVAGRLPLLSPRLIMARAAPDEARELMAAEPDPEMRALIAAHWLWQALLATRRHRRETFARRAPLFRTPRGAA